MAEKGGKGYSRFSSGKSAVQSPTFLLGKDNGSTKSKKGMKVRFESEDGWGNGGKGGKAANGGKSPVKKATPLELRVEDELPMNATCLMDCEAAQILEGIQEQMVVLSEDPKIKIPNSFDKGLQLAKRSSDYTSPQSVKRVLHRAESADEVFALVPSLKGKKSKLQEPLEHAVDELAKLRCL